MSMHLFLPFRVISFDPIIFVMDITTRTLTSNNINGEREIRSFAPIVAFELLINMMRYFRRNVIEINAEQK